MRVLLLLSSGVPREERADIEGSTSIILAVEARVPVTAGIIEAGCVAGCFLGVVVSLLSRLYC